MQKSAKTGVYFDYLVTDPVMGQICIEVTGRRDYEVEFVENDYHDEFLDAKYNQGRLGILQYHNTATYISFSDEKETLEFKVFQQPLIDFIPILTQIKSYIFIFFHVAVIMLLLITYLCID